MGEGERAHFAPIDLQVLTEQPFKPDRHIGGGPLLLPPDPTHHVAKHTASAGVRLVWIAACQFQHTNCGQFLAKPVFNLRTIWVDVGGPATARRCLIDWFLQGPGNGGAAAA